MNWESFNTLYALAVVFAAAACIARMNGTTPHGVRLGIVLIFAAGFGQFLGPLMQQWGHWLDTLLYTGVIVLLVFNRRYRRPHKGGCS